MRYLMITLLALCIASSAMGSVIFDTIPNPDPAGMASFGYQACSIYELGDKIEFENINGKLGTVRVGMVSWADISSDYTSGGAAYTDTSIQTDAAGWFQPITINIYNVDGSLITTKTQTFHIPWATGGIHPYHAVIFDFSDEDIALPSQVVYGIAFNTQSHGYHPTGLIGPYNSLNLGAYRDLILTGTDVDPLRGWVYSTFINGTGAMYGPETKYGSGFRNSDGEDFTSGYKGSVEFNTVDRYTVAPNTLASELEFSEGINPFGFDFDSVAPSAAPGAPAGFGNSSFSATVIDGDALESNRYKSFRVSPQAIFGHSVKLGDIVSMSYYTNNIDSTIDWRYTIYTKPTGTNDFKTWCHTRVESNLNPTSVKGEWHKWSTDSMLFTINRTGALVYNSTWNTATSGEYASNEINYFDLILGANSGGGTGTSQLDGVTIKLANGEIAEIDLAKDPTLSLNVDGDPLYVKTNQLVTVDMHVSDLPAMVNSCQALLGFDAGMLDFVTIAPAQGSVWTEAWVSPLQTTPGSLDAAAVINVEAEPGLGTMVDGNVAKLTFNTRATDGTTIVNFRTDEDAGYATLFGCVGGSIALYPTKVNSQEIIIDGTPPTAPGLTLSTTFTNGNAVTATITASTDANPVTYFLIVNGTVQSAVVGANTVALPADGSYTIAVKAVDAANNEVTSAVQTVVRDTVNPTMTFTGVNPKYLIGDTVDVSVTPADERSGVKSIAIEAKVGEQVIYSSTGTTMVAWTGTIDASWPNGTYVATVTVTDNADNISTETQSFVVNKNQVSGTVTLPFLGTSRDVIFRINNTENRSITLTFTEGVANYQLRDVQTVTSLSADTAWTLRQTKSVAANNDGQYTSNFTLLGGDLNNDNIVNALDYSILKANWGAKPAGDIDGLNGTGAPDYGIVKANWFVRGN